MEYTCNLEKQLVVTKDKCIQVKLLCPLLYLRSWYKFSSIFIPLTSQQHTQFITIQRSLKRHDKG